jgi:imidazolonepropionase-like amidohydrolase
MLASPTPFVAAFMQPDEKFRRIGVDYRRRFVAAGGKLLLGTDAPNLGMVHGYATHAARIGLAEIFSPLEIIRMATHDAAAAVSFTLRIGSTTASRIRTAVGVFWFASMTVNMGP